MRAYEFRQFGLEHLALVERDAPRAAANEVVVKFHAASLNYRDLMFAKGVYNPRARLPAVPFSDGAGEVVSVGERVTRWKVGDRVCPIFTQGWIEGGPTAQKNRTALGAGDVDGVLREFGAFDESGLVAIPSHLSYEEAATLPCAAVTAWNALVEFGRVQAGDTVLTLGTGGVSVFAIQLARAMGARPVVTSSSDDKLARARELGADVLANYATRPDWDAAVLEALGGRGVDAVIETGGQGTLPRSIAATRVGGAIALIGVLTSEPVPSLGPVLLNALTIHGVYVGSTAMLRELIAAMDLHRIRPVIDRRFAFADAPAAYDHLRRQEHVGKVVITDESE